MSGFWFVCFQALASLRFIVQPAAHGSFFREISGSGRPGGGLGCVPSLPPGHH